MFDLPVETEKQRRAYRVFRKYLVQNGFMMMQKSIYTKIALNHAAAYAIIGNVRKNKPEEGWFKCCKLQKNNLLIWNTLLVKQTARYWILTKGWSYYEIAVYRLWHRIVV